VPEITLLEPTTIRDVVMKLPTPETLVLKNKLPTTPWPYPSVTWDVIRGSRMIGRPNVPNSEAHIVPRLGISQQSAGFLYYREKKVFEPTTLHWLRQPGSLTNIANAEQAVMREVTDLNQRLDNLIEWSCWQAISGVLAFQYDDVVANVDYQLPASHLPSTPAAGWSQSTTTVAQIVGNVQAWKRLINRDARIKPTEAYCTELTMTYVMAAFARAAQTLMSDRMREAYYASGVLPGFMGLDWIEVESQYDIDNIGTTALFLPDGALVIANLGDNRPMEVMEGPSADDEAPQGFTGRFTKTWQEKDPSARQILLEDNFLPIIRRPEQIVYVEDVG
jgi:hypothetical protein